MSKAGTSTSSAGNSGLKGLPKSSLPPVLGIALLFHESSLLTNFMLFYVKSLCFLQASYYYY